MKLALGSVQFGMEYGVSNDSGQVVLDQISVILSRAKELGLNTIDTAIEYGDSETRLGQSGVEGWNVITKLPELPESGVDIFSWVNEQITESLERLKISSLSGVLFHNPKQLLTPNGKLLWSSIQELKKRGIVKKIGFSIYSPEELDLLCPFFPPDIVQAPYNIFDRRIVTSGWHKRMVDMGIEVHVRSIFLQGLLLMTRDTRPAKFERWAYLWDLWEQILEDNCLTPLQACLHFVMNEEFISKVVVGVHTLTQLEEICALSNERVEGFLDYPSSENVDLIDPSHWSSF